MSTYAIYRVWVGLKSDELSDVNSLFIDETFNALDGIERDGLVLKSIHMHGETIGLGVVLVELNWETELQQSNLYDLSLCNQAVDIRERLNRVFQDLGIQKESVVYHHIDLGG